MESTEFAGLTMPVFNAFGWAGEEAALTFALEQLEQFAGLLQSNLSSVGQNLFPHHGVDKQQQVAYIATDRDYEEGIYITFQARPMTFNVSISISERSQMITILKQAQQTPEIWHAILASIPADWSLRLQQLEVDENSGAQTNYQDVYKGELNGISSSDVAEFTDRALYLNGEDKWIVKLFLSRRYATERISVMGDSSPSVLAKDINELEPLLRWFGEKTKRIRKKRASRAKSTKSTKRKTATKAPVSAAAPASNSEGFTYVAELKPLHIRKGFINLTPDHWPFFAKSARAETQPIVLKVGSNTDDKSAVWRLVPNDLARIVLSDKAQRWLEDNFTSGDRIQVVAIKRSPKEFEVTLSEAAL